MRIGLLSDTHGFLDDAVFDHFGDCDEVWHAGDFGTPGVLERLRAFKPLRGVYGNVDGPELRAGLPEDLVWECEGVTLYMTHVGGYPGNYDGRAGREVRWLRPGLFICGHSHILKIMRDPALGLLHMNPGACGHHGWHLVRTMLRFTVEAGKISRVDAIELGPAAGVTVRAGAKATNERTAERIKGRIEYMPAIIRFLGYNPLPPGRRWAERLVHCRLDGGAARTWEAGPNGQVSSAGATTCHCRGSGHPCPDPRD